jgi:tRNA (guanine26-N2/guanine27-N2)-dimethyltransferase
VVYNLRSMSTISENSSSIKVKLPKKDVHAKMEVFYNPVMKSNRNISVVLLNSIENENMNIALPLVGSGIRGLRFLQELDKGKIGSLFVNDKKEDFVKVFKDNLKLNKLKTKKVHIHNEEASLFLLNQINHDRGIKKFCGYFDYIDIDPFGTPNGFLSAAVARICRNGILAVTATDTAALSGTYPAVTLRKYWAKSLKNYMMHETGLRILIRKVQLLGIQFDKALIPILSYHKDHYFRIYFKYVKGKSKCDEIIKQHKYLLFNDKTLEFKASDVNVEKGFDYAGPLWVGKLLDQKLLDVMVEKNTFSEEEKFLSLLKKEATKDTLGFIDLHVWAKRHKKNVPVMAGMLKKLQGVRTHFSRNGVKTRKKL